MCLRSAFSLLEFFFFLRAKTIQYCYGSGAVQKAILRITSIKFTKIHFDNYMGSSRSKKISKIKFKASGLGGELQPSSERPWLSWVRIESIGPVPLLEVTFRPTVQGCSWSYILFLLSFPCSLQSFILFLKVFFKHNFSKDHVASRWERFSQFSCRTEKACNKGKRRPGISSGQ